MRDIGQEVRCESGVADPSASLRMTGWALRMTRGVAGWRTLQDERECKVGIKLSHPFGDQGWLNEIVINLTDY